MKVAIAGYGIEGKANLDYYQRLGAEVTILDEKSVTEAPKGVHVISGPQAFADISSYDMVVRTASLRPDKLSQAKKVWSATNEFLAKCQAPIVGVTGTKGKGTTSSLIASILRAAGKTVHLVGNIGVPALEVLPRIRPEDIVVFEMSSFQLWDLEKSPSVAVVLMIEPDHLDVHQGMDEYLAAKANIRVHQRATDACYYHPTNQYSQRIALSGEGLAAPCRYGVADDSGVYVDSNNFCVQGQQICSVSALQIPGAHNVENACAAISAARALGVDAAAVEAGLRAFTGLPHRIKFIRDVDGVRYFDDNYSSAPGATIAAVRAFSEPEILIAGGYDKHIQFDELAAAVAAQPNIKKVILIGQTRMKIAAALDSVGKSDLYVLSDDTSLRPIVEMAKTFATAGDVVIMSPGCASFDMFRNFGDRGDQFIALVEGL